MIGWVKMSNTNTQHFLGPLFQDMNWLCFITMDSSMRK